MSEHTPPPNHPPAPSVPAGDQDAAVDQVPGDPPVPITVWRTAPGADETTAIPGRLAYRLVAAYSRPGETVIDLTAGHALTAACQRGARAHHKAWFTDAAAMIIGPATPTMPDEPNDEPDTDTDLIDPYTNDRSEPEPPDLSAWFGDDLTDPAGRSPRCPPTAPRSAPPASWSPAGPSTATTSPPGSGSRGCWPRARNCCDPAAAWS